VEQKKRIKEEGERLRLIKIANEREHELLEELKVLE